MRHNKHTDFRYVVGEPVLLNNPNCILHECKVIVAARFTHRPTGARSYDVYFEKGACMVSKVPEHRLLSLEVLDTEPTW